MIHTFNVIKYCQIPVQLFWIQLNSILRLRTGYFTLKVSQNQYQYHFAEMSPQAHFANEPGLKKKCSNALDVTLDFVSLFVILYILNDDSY